MSIVHVQGTDFNQAEVTSASVRLMASFQQCPEVP